MKKLIWWVIILVVVTAIGYFVIINIPTDEGNVDSNQPVEIEDSFGTKVVYATDMSVDREPLIKDCELRSGTFNSCGSICGPDAEACPQVCAYTCDDIESDNTLMESTTTVD